MTLTAPRDVHQPLASSPALPIHVAPASSTATAASRGSDAAAPQPEHGAPPGVAVVTTPAAATAAAPLHGDGECAERFCVVDIPKQPGNSSGLTISNEPSVMVILEVHDEDENRDETHICEWSRARRATYPWEVVKPHDRIVRINDVRPKPRPSSAFYQQIRAQIFSQTTLLLHIARSTSRRWPCLQKLCSSTILNSVN